MPHTHTVYLDESGDLGFKLSEPYRKGGSSRYLTIAFIVCPQDKRHLLKRLVKRIYIKYGFHTATEIKGSDLTNGQRKDFSQRIIDLINREPGISIFSITTNKVNVQMHIREDANLLYNFMMRLALLDKISAYESVALVRDNKSVKIRSGNSLSEYLKTTLMFEYNSKTKLSDLPSDSKQNHNLILTDWLNNIVWSHYEDSNSEAFMILSAKLKSQTLFF